MPEKFRNTYRIATTRLAPQHYLSGYFFVTICTTGQRCFFGNITDENMEFSGIGVIARNCLIDIPDHFPNACLDEYVVMRNHIHCILSLNAETLLDTETLHATSLPQRDVNELP